MFASGCSAAFQIRQGPGGSDGAVHCPQHLQQPHGLSLTHGGSGQDAAMMKDTLSKSANDDQPLLHTLTCCPALRVAVTFTSW